MSAADRFAFHRATPEVSVNEHVRRCCIELGASVMQRQRVYLDKCFWIRLRDARSSASREPAARSLLDGLVDAVGRGSMICPISEALFLELMKQTDLGSRAATAALIDLLSGGVTLIPSQTRVATEVAHFLHARLGHSVHPLTHLVWTKVPNVLGVQHPAPAAFAPAEQRVIQKAFFDHMWTLSLSDMVQTIGDASVPDLAYVSLAERLNRQNLAHASQMKSFAQVYRDEFDGVLELAVPTVCDVLYEMFTKAQGAQAVEPPEYTEEIRRQALGLIRAAARKPGGRQAFRTLHVGALLHAAVRWNRSQKLDANDIHDFQHAEAALGYCDVLLTDGPMHALLSQKHLALERDFACRVMSSLEDAVDWIRQQSR